MKLTMPVTGNALVTECYHTCFLIEENGQLFMVDGGGGNAVLHLKAEKLYSRKGKRYYHGSLWIPDDLEVITL